MSKIKLMGMEFYAYHGYHAEEQILGNKFIVDVTIDADTSDAEENDELSRTINYFEVYKLVKMEMSIKSKLLEHVATRIIDTIYEAFPNIIKAEVTVSKLNPPLEGKVDRVSITLSR
jgi:7,8-dihydroneopterin aldolase/epimerase/oxygenase